MKFNKNEFGWKEKVSINTDELVTKNDIPHYNEILITEISGDDYRFFRNNNYFNMSALNLDETKSYVGKDIDITDDEEYTFKFVYDKEANAFLGENSFVYIYNHKSYNGENFVEDVDSAVLTFDIIPMVISEFEGEGYFKLYEVEKLELDNKCLPDDLSIPNSLTVGTRIGDIGEFSVTEGDEITASGNCSHAEGAYTTASGNISHAEGGYTTASGDFSHAECDGAEASGVASHAEGGYTTASGDYSHAEGGSTIASGSNSHAEGESTEARGDFSHAEGHTTTALGDSSHIEGKSSNLATDKIQDLSSSTSDDDILTAWNTNKFSLAKGTASHVEGFNCLALDNYSHAEGNATQALYQASHAEGTNTVASDICSHAEGYETIASGGYSHAEGSITKATELYSHAEGNYSEASGKTSHAEGYETIASGEYSHAEGYKCKSESNSSHAEGCLTEANNFYTHAEGFYTIAKGYSQHVQGKCNIEDTAGKYAHIVGNGESETERSNAHTLDWQGNAWYQGKLSQDGTPTEDKDLTTKKYVDDKAIVEQIPILRIDEDNKIVYVNCNEMGTYKKYFVPNKYANVYSFSFVYTNDDNTETEIVRVGGALTRDDFVLCSRNTSSQLILVLGNTDKYTYAKSTKTIATGLNGYLKIGNTAEFTPTSDYNPATKKYVDDAIASQPTFSFNDSGELVVTINGVTKIFVPKQ